MIYFSSDPHHSHINLCAGISRWEDKSGCRPFNSIEEHNEAIVNGINETVGPDDIYFCLGDWSFGGVDNVSRFRNAIRCRTVNLIYGNHDRKIRKSEVLRSLFSWTGDLYNLSAEGHQFVLCHYPMAVWEDMGDGVIHLFGHCHQNYNTKGQGKMLDVGVEGHNYKPWSLDEIVDYMKDIPVVKKDHH